MNPYHLLFDRVLTRTDAEWAHRTAFTGIRAAGPVLGGWSRLRSTASRSNRVETTPHRVLGIDFPGRLGLAAGFDKNAVGIDGLAALGFGFVEVGTVTGEPQPGNPRPRLARLPDDRAIVNRMGFNNDGAEAVARRLAGRRFPVPVGVNIGKTKAVPDDAAIADYAKSTTLLAPYADYLVVNVSSPNTPGLRDLQAVEKLEPLVRAVREIADRSATPVLVKIAPDLADDDVLAVADLAVAVGLGGVVATNTTIARDGLVSSPAQIGAAGAGGLSGPPLKARATAVVRLLRDRVGPDLAIIGVGGIASYADAEERLAAGADLVQAYTAFVYEGPRWAWRINRALDRAHR